MGNRAVFPDAHVEVQKVREDGAPLMVKDCRNCKFAGMDMDMDPYCVNAGVLGERSKVTGRTYPYGLDINPAFVICKLDFWAGRETAGK